MNFAAQFFYSRYLSERLERLYSPRPAMTDCVENDPFWQRWETAADPDSLDTDTLDPDTLDPDTLYPDTLYLDTPDLDTPNPDTLYPDTLDPDTLDPETLDPDTLYPDTLDPDTLDPESPVHKNPLVAAPTPLLPEDDLPRPLHLEEQQNPAIGSGINRPSLPSSCPAPPHPAALPAPPPRSLTKKQPSGMTTSSELLPPLPPPLPPHTNPTAAASEPTFITPTAVMNPRLHSGTPSRVRAQESKRTSWTSIPPRPQDPPRPPVPSRARFRVPSLPTKLARSVASTLASPSSPQASPPSATPCPLLISLPASVGGLFYALVSFLLRLVLSFVLLILPSEELRLGPNLPQGCKKGGPGMFNGIPGRRPTLIEPERLKDFGEEELLNGDVRVWEARPSGRPEIQMTEPPKIRRMSEFKSRVRPSTDYLRFEDISAATFKIQSAIQKTPCTYSRLSKQYGMEIYLKKEHLHYTGSVKERGVFYLLTSLTQEQQKKGVIVATDCNFSMAVAHHAVELKIPVFAIMPSSCSVPRLRVYRDYGAMVISYGTAARDSRNHACHLAKDNGYLYLEEDEQEAYLAGLGTVGLEIYEQVPKLDAVVVPASGQFGLLAGAAAAIKHLNPRILVVGVEPEGYPLLLQSLKTGAPYKDMTSRPNSKLYGDLAEHSLGIQTFQLAKKHVDKIITVSEESSLVAMLRFQEFERSTVDTEGAMGLAAILAGQLPELRGKRVAVVVSSANMELDLVRQCVERALVLDERISKFTVEMGNLPGDMAKLLDFLSREDVRLLDVCHRRHSDKTELFKTQVECVVETRDKTQSVQLRKTLCERYPSLRWLDR